MKIKAEEGPTHKSLTKNNFSWLILVGIKNLKEVMRIQDSILKIGEKRSSLELQNEEELFKIFES